MVKICFNKIFKVKLFQLEHSTLVYLGTTTPFKCTVYSLGCVVQYSIYSEITNGNSKEWFAKHTGLKIVRDYPDSNPHFYTVTQVKSGY